MTPNPPLPDPNDETACSLPSNPPPSDRTATDAAADATVIRAGAAAPTVGDTASATNFGRYELVGEIARGGMGVVYKARQHGLDRLVALKMILGTGTDHEATQRFFQEARAAAALDHPNVVPIYDIDEIGGSPYFTMALVEGPNIRGYVDANGLPPVPALVALFAQTVAGVAHAHRHGIVHRDLKPANVLVDRDGRPRVTDFGLAKRASADAQLTATGQVVGTPAYMAPEQARESKEVGPPADVYSLGAVLYFLLTGKPPFHADNLTDLLIKVVMEPPVPPRALRPDIPADIEALCLRCLAKSPGDRFADAQELAAALVPITDRYLAPSAHLTPSAAQIAFAQGPTTPSIGSLPFATADSVPSLASALPKPGAAPRSPSAPVAVPNRKPLLLALGAVAVVLAAVAGYLALSNKPKPDAPTVEKGTPPTATPPGLNPPPAGANAEKFAWPVATRADFTLTVEPVSEGATRDANGVLQLTAGKQISIRLKADRDCHVSVWSIDPKGQPEKMFPSKYETDDRVFAGRERVVPGDNSYEIGLSATEGEGVERLRVFATTGAQPLYPPGTEKGQFVVYSSDAERERLASTVRGMVLKKTGTAEPPAEGAVADREFLFRVSK